MQSESEEEVYQAPKEEIKIDTWENKKETVSDVESEDQKQDAIEMPDIVDDDSDS